MKKSSVFKMPKPVKIKARVSSLTNAFVNGIIPVIEPSEQEVQDALEELGMSDGIRCAYCGGQYTEWDHFYPLVKNKKPSGNISEINNLVPCCSTCNSEKGNKPWRQFMEGKQPHDKAWNDRFKRLERYDTRKRIQISEEDFQQICGKKWLKHWDNLDSLVMQINEYQALSDEIRQTLKNKYVPGSQKETTPPAQSTTEVMEAIKIGKYVRKYMWPVLEHLPDSEVASLLTKEYSKKVFGMSGFSILSETFTSRYYASPVQINGKTYYVCSQWREGHWDKLKKWMEGHQG